MGHRRGIYRTGTLISFELIFIINLRYEYLFGIKII